MSVNSNCPNVSAAVKAVAKAMNVSEGDALRVLVGRGAADVARSLTTGSGLEGVRVHTATPPARTSGAQAYAQGQDLHLAPGPQAQILPHEAWHVVQGSTRQIEAASARNGTAGRVTPLL